jgi:hypothetical protein
MRRTRGGEGGEEGEKKEKRKEKEGKGKGRGKGEVGGGEGGGGGEEEEEGGEKKEKKGRRRIQTIIFAATTSEVCFLASPQTFVPLLYSLKSAKLANLVSDKYRCCHEFPLARTVRPGQRILLFAKKATVLPSTAPGYGCWKAKHIAHATVFFEFLSCFFRCRYPFNSLLLSHLLFHLCQQICTIFLMQRVLCFQTFCIFI